MMPPAQHEVDERNLRVLIVGSDPSLEDEFRVALSGIADTHGVLHFAETYRQALEIGRARQPRLIVIDVDRDVADIAGVSKELLEAVPGASVVAAFKLDQLEQNASESATIIELLRAQVRDFIRRPLSATELRVILDRLFSRVAPAAETAQGRVVTFLSNKGGVGRSTLAVNVACGLALRYPDEVLLIDASLQGGSCAWMLALKPQAGIVDVVRQKDRLDATLLRNLTTKHTSGVRLLAAPADALEGAEVDDEAIARLLSMARRSFRYVIVDTHATLDNVVMTALDLTDIAFVVVQGMAPAVAGVAKLLPVLEGLGLPPSRQRLVLNYNYQPFLGNLRPADIADRLQRTLEYVIPYEKRVLQSMNAGSPQVMQGGWWQRFGKTITELVDDLDGGNEEVSGAETPSAARSRGKLDTDDRRKGLLAGG
jgi:pilus assembly protein CpaE